MNPAIFPAAFPAAMSAVGYCPGVANDLPPLWDTKLLSYYPGLIQNNLLVDKKRGINIGLFQSHCIYLDEISAFGTTSTDHGFIVSYEGTSTPSYDGSTLSVTEEGTLYNVTFSDGVHYRFAEGDGGYSWSDNGQHHIAWNGVFAELWAQRQDTYHSNAVKGWWEIEGDPVKYPYPVDGYDIYHGPGKFNGSESKYGYTTTPVGTFDGASTVLPLSRTYTITGAYKITFGWRPERLDIDQKIADSDGERFEIHYSAASGQITLKSPYMTSIFVDSVETNVIPNTAYHIITISGIGTGQQINWLGTRYNNTGSKLTGVLRDFHLQDEAQNVLIPIDEGAGTAIHDSDKNIIGAISTADINAFWENSAQMVPQSIVEAEALQGLPILTDGDGHPVLLDQTALLALVNNNMQDYLGEKGLIRLAAMATADEDVKIKKYLGIE